MEPFTQVNGAVYLPQFSQVCGHVSVTRVAIVILAPLARPAFEYHGHGLAVTDAGQRLPGRW